MFVVVHHNIGRNFCNSCRIDIPRCRISITKIEEDLLQIARESQFPGFEEIEIRLAMINTYDNWPKTRQTLKRVILGRHPCARTGLTKLAGPIQETSEPIELMSSAKQRCGKHAEDENLAPINVLLHSISILEK